MTSSLYGADGVLLYDSKFHVFFSPPLKTHVSSYLTDLLSPNEFIDSLKSSDAVFSSIQYQVTYSAISNFFLKYEVQKA